MFEDIAPTKKIGFLKPLGVIANIQEGWLAPRAFGGAPGYDYARSSAQSKTRMDPWIAGRLFPFGALVQSGARIAGGCSP